MNQYVLYHGNCPDGLGAALAASFSSVFCTAKFIPVNYGQPLPEMEPKSQVLIVDFSYSKEILLGLCKSMAQVIVLDHHESARRDLEELVLPGQSFVAFDMNESGATMTWRYLFPDHPVPDFFSYLRDRDLWKFELPMSREVSMAIRSYPLDLDSFQNLFNTPLEDLMKAGVHCRRLTEQQVDMMAKNHRWVWITPEDHRWVWITPEDRNTKTGDIEVADASLYTERPTVLDYGWVMPCANASVFFSEVGERLLELYPNIQCAAYYFDRKDGMRQWGLRSRPDFDCSLVAKAMGGGGHKQASGFQTRI